MPTGRRRLSPHQVFCLLDFIGLIIALFSTTGEIMQWGHDEEVDTKTAQPNAMGYWYHTWLFSIVMDALGLIWLAILAYIDGRKHWHSEHQEFLAMVLIWISGAAELYASLMYEPLQPAFAHLWFWILVTSVRHSWTLAALGNFVGITLLMIGYMPYASGRRTLGWDFWGLLVIALACGLDMRIVNPHHAGYSTMASYALPAAGLRATQGKRKKVYTLGWKVSGSMEAIGMTVLIIAEVYEHMYVKKNDGCNTLLTLALMPPLDTRTGDESESDDQEAGQDAPRGHDEFASSRSGSAELAVIQELGVPLNPDPRPPEM